MRLIVDDGGKRRAFRLGQGVLRVGSSEEADLRLASEGVAALHARLVLAGGELTVQPEPDARTLVAGTPITAATPAKPRAIIALGHAKLWCELEEGDAPDRRPGGPSRPLAHAHESVVKVRPRRAERQYGLPSWAVVALVLLVVAVSIPFLQKALRASAEHGEASADSRLDAARDLIEVGEYEKAERRLDLAAADTELTDAERDDLAVLRERLAAEREATRRALEDMAGTNYKNLLERYEHDHLEGDPEPAKVRLFLKRAQVFHERWPEHPELSWVERQESRFSSLVDLSQPPTWRDVEWEAMVLVRSAPRNYGEAFRLLDGFLEHAEGGEKIHATKLRDRFEVDRIEYHADRMAVAQREYEKGDVTAAVWWLVHEIIWSGEPSMADQAARVLVRMPDALDHLRGYRSKYPEKFAALLENDVVRQVWEADVRASAGG